MNHSKLMLKFLLTFLLASCEKFEYSLNQVNNENKYSNINQQNISSFIHNQTDTIKIAVIGDTQRFYELTRKAIDVINLIPDINFVIHTGDLVDFGLQREYIWMHELLTKLNYPYIAVIGNHDLIANGGDIYKQMYGEFNFSFIFSGNKFIFLNSNSIEYNFDGTVPNVPWLEQQISDTSNYNHAIVINHIPPFHEDFDPDLEEEYVSALEVHGKTMLVINGHRHDFELADIYGNGIYFLNSSSTSHEKIVILKIWGHDFSVELIEVSGYEN